MNKRIQDLASQCYGEDSSKFYTHQFAALIINECCEIVQRRHQMSTNSQYCLTAIDIRTHFGLTDDIYINHSISDAK
jgi:hypothetical protein